MVTCRVIVSHYYCQSRKSSPILLLRFYPSTLRSRSDASFPSSFDAPACGRSDLANISPFPFWNSRLGRSDLRTFPRVSELSPFLSNPYALFCTYKNLNPFLFKRFRTLCKKPPGWGEWWTFRTSALRSLSALSVSALSFSILAYSLLRSAFQPHPHAGPRIATRPLHCLLFTVPYPPFLSPTPYHPLSFSRNFISRTLVPISKNRHTAGQEASRHVRPQ